MVEMSYLLPMLGDSSSETCSDLVNDDTDDPKTRFRTGIARHGQQI